MLPRVAQFSEKNSSSKSTLKLTYSKLSVREFSFEELAVEAGDMGNSYTLRALKLAGAGIGTVAKAQLIHLGHHGLGAALGLRTALGQQSERTHAGSHEQHGRSVLASSHTCTATNASGSIHTLFGLVVRDEDVIGILSRTGTHGNKAAGLQYLVKCRTVNHQILYDGESGTPPGLHRDGGAVLKVTHKQLTGSDMVVRTMGPAVNIQRAGTADTLAAVMVERYGAAALATALDGHRVTALAYKLFIQNIQHFKEGRIFLYTRNMICLEMTFCLGVLLAPNL